MANMFDTRITKDELKTLLDSKWVTRLGEDLFDRPYWETIVDGINKTISTKGSVIPRKTQIFAALNNFDPSNFRVLMIGQDPYPTPGNATGYAFSSANGRPAPASLKQIFKEIDQEYGSNMFKERAFKGSLDQWTDQGVLLLNSVLTIGFELEKHTDIGWKSFVGDVIKYLDETYIFVTLALGTEAIKMANDNIVNNKNMIVTAGHPSPLNRTRPFIGSKCFEKVNSILMTNNMLTIKWVLQKTD